MNKLNFKNRIFLKYFIAIVLGFGLFQGSAAQEKDFLNEQRNFSKYILANSEVGYITFLGGFGNMSHLWFEGKLVPNYLLRVHKNAKWGVVLTPKIVFRMYREDSQPVRTPSYMPQVSFYYMMNEPTNNFNNIFYIFGKFVHHSNGQVGDFFNKDQSVNTNSGDFSTNYFEIGGFLTKLLTPQLNATEFFKTSLEYHPILLQFEPLNDLYGNIRWHNDIQIFKFTKKTLNSFFSGNDDRSQYENFHKRPMFRATINTTLIFGKMKNIDALDFSKRFCLSVTFSYHPNFLQDVRIFSQYYYGQDYYNMYFEDTLNLIRFGLMVDPFNL
jgi:hypothetical protein